MLYFLSYPDLYFDILGEGVFNELHLNAEKMVFQNLFEWPNQDGRLKKGWIVVPRHFIVLVM